MVKICMILLICSLCITKLVADGIDKSPEAVEKWFDQINKTEKISKLHFFVHETNGGIYGQTIYPVAQPNISLTTASAFGRLNMYDNPLKVGSDPETEIIGKAQGLSSYSSLEESSITMNMNFVFTAGEYNDSSLTVAGRNPFLTEQYREMVVVGGSGVFRLAKGIATAQTTWRNETTRDIIVEYNVVVIHYDIPATVTMNTHMHDPISTYIVA